MSERTIETKQNNLKLIKESLAKHPGASIIDLVRYTGLSSRDVLWFVNNGYIGFMSDNIMEKQIKGYYMGSTKKDKWYSKIFSRK